MSDDLVKRLRDTPNWMREGFQDWKDNVRTYDRAPFEAAARIEELEALYEAARHDAQEAEAYAEALEAKLYDIAQDELKGQIPGPWPNAIRAVNYRVGTTHDGSPVWHHRLEQYHEGQWAAIPVYDELENGTLEEEDQ